MSKTLRNSLISVIILIVLFTGAGVAYTYMSGGAEVKTPAPAAKTTSEPPRIVKPKPPAPNAAVGVSIGEVSTPVTAGANASLTARTTPTASCTISVIYNGSQSKDSGLGAKAADAYGVVNWAWTVESTVPAGNWPIKVTCGYNGRSAVAQTSLQVTK